MIQILKCLFLGKGGASQYSCSSFHGQTGEGSFTLELCCAVNPGVNTVKDPKERQSLWTETGSHQKV